MALRTQQKSGNHRIPMRTSKTRSSGRLKVYLRTSLKRITQSTTSVGNIPAEVHVMIQNILDRASNLSMTPYIPQLPGDLTKFFLQSPAEVEYKKARALAIQYDEKFANSIAVMVAERFEQVVGKIHRAFEWAKISGDQGVLKRIGVKAAKEYRERAYLLSGNGFISNELAVDLYRNAIEFAKDSESIDLAKGIGVEAAKRYEDFGDACIYNPISSVLGLGFGYVRAIRWAKACDDTVLAEKIRDKVVNLYENYNMVNLANLAFASAMGDREQVILVRHILETKRKKSQRQI